MSTQGDQPVIGLQEFEAAREALRDVAHVTPIQSSSAVHSIDGVDALFKCENLQKSGSFKVRGAYVRMARLGPEQRAAGVVAASAGNHAQGVALAATRLGIRATVYMPVGAALTKVVATRSYGAQVRLVGRGVDEALAAAREEAARTGATLVHPFDHPDIIAGQGTIGLEILDQVPDVRTVLVPVGGGGLVAGIAEALAQAAPQVRVIGVEAASMTPYVSSLEAGHVVSVPVRDTMADGIAVGTPGELPFQILARRHVEMRAVDEEALSQAVLLLAERAKLVVEPAGAAGVAYLLGGGGESVEGPVVSVLSGGNVDAKVLMQILRHGLSVSGRYSRIDARVADRPGELARLLARLSEAEANVLEVVHTRTSDDLPVGDVDVTIRIETKGPEHFTEVLARLREGGVRVRDAR